MLSGLPLAVVSKGWASELLIVGFAVHVTSENRFTNGARNIILTIRTDNKLTYQYVKNDILASQR